MSNAKRISKVQIGVQGIAFIACALVVWSLIRSFFWPIEDAEGEIISQSVKWTVFLDSTFLMVLFWLMLPIGFFASVAQVEIGVRDKTFGNKVLSAGVCGMIGLGFFSLILSIKVALSKAQPIRVKDEEGNDTHEEDIDVW